MNERLQKMKHLSGIATVLSFLACYGTLAAVTLLAMVGLSLPVNATAWTGAIVAFSALAVISLVVSFWNHRKRWPLAVGLMGFSALTYALLVQYNWAIELLGFVALAGAAFLDRRARKIPTRS
jgi:hypothetical protein